MYPNKTRFKLIQQPFSEKKRVEVYKLILIILYSMHKLMQKKIIFKESLLLHREFCRITLIITSTNGLT